MSEAQVLPLSRSAKQDFFAPQMVAADADASEIEHDFFLPAQVHLSTLMRPSMLAQNQAFR